MSQKSNVLAHMKSGMTITSWQAITMFGATRLSAIVYDLRAMGHDVESKIIVVKNRDGVRVPIAEYSLSAEK
jgi:hypothetical protein